MLGCRYLLDLGEEETAAALGVPRGTVKSRTSRALARLRAVMEQGAAPRAGDGGAGEEGAAPRAGDGGAGPAACRGRRGGRGCVTWSASCARCA